MENKFTIENFPNLFGGSQEKMDDFLAKLGLGPKYTPKVRPTYECPRCHKTNATKQEEHGDTGFDEVVLNCPDCNYSSG